MVARCAIESCTNKRPDAFEGQSKIGRPDRRGPGGVAMHVPPAPSPADRTRPRSARAFGLWALGGALAVLLFYTPGASPQPGAQPPGSAPLPRPPAPGAPGDPGQEGVPVSNSIRSITGRPIPAARTGAVATSIIEIEVPVPASVGAGNERVTLAIGGQHFVSSRYPPGGDSSRLIFMLAPEEFARLRTG